MSANNEWTRRCRPTATRHGIAMGLVAGVLLTVGACTSDRHESKRNGDPPAATAEQPPEADWCAEHGVPESECTRCNPNLIEAFKAAGDWCAGHGLPESQCTKCNPGLLANSTAAVDWCAEHGLPESKCTRCSPELIAQFKDSGDWCVEHGFPESACQDCSPQATIAPGTLIRFRSSELEQASGIAVVDAREAALQVGIECTARIEFNRNRLADIRSPFPGVVLDVLVDLGQSVEREAPLFVVESAHVGSLQGELRAARQRVDVARTNHERQVELREARIASDRQLELSQQDLESAEAELRSIEVSLRIAGAPGAGPEGRFRLRAPIAGTIVRRPATLGTFATNEASLATVADTSTVWALLEVRETDVGAVRNGQRVTIHVDGLPGREFAGTLTWIASEVDPRTRTVEARAEVANADGLLRAEQFARATIRVAVAEDAVAVPRQAIQRVGEESVVFVRLASGVYEPRVVTPGRSNSDLVQIRGAVSAGDSVVTEGAYLLRTELARGSLGAGCCDVESLAGS